MSPWLIFFAIVLVCCGWKGIFEFGKLFIGGMLLIVVLICLLLKIIT